MKDELSKVYKELDKLKEKMDSLKYVSAVIDERPISNEEADLIRLLRTNEIFEVFGGRGEAVVFSYPPENEVLSEGDIVAFTLKDKHVCTEIREAFEKLRDHYEDVLRSE